MKQHNFILNPVLERTLLIRRLFPEEVRRVSNVSGKDKEQLDPDIISYVKKTAFERWPLAQDEKFSKEWSECKIAIDEANRRLNRPAKKTIRHFATT